MKKTMKKILALVLSMLMLLSVAAPVFANEATATECPEVHTKANLGEGNYTFISEHNREFCADQYYNVYKCNTCGKYFADDIEEGVACQFETIKPATCTEEGMKKCTVCDYEVVIAKAPHNYVPDKTCGYNGEDVTWTCSVCNDSYVRPFDRDHKWEITVTLEPTCDTNGNAHYLCTICGFEKDVEIIADATHIGHTWVKGEAQEGKCFNDEEGTTQPTIIAGYYCEDCGVSAKVGQIIVVDGEEVEVESEYQVIPFNHDIDLEIPTTHKDPTCTEFGFDLYGCKLCGYVAKVDVLNPTGHNYDKDTFALVSTKCGKNVDDVLVVGRDTYTGVCDKCLNTVTLVEEHVIEYGKVKAPTCMAAGYTYDYCETCDEEFNKRNPVDIDPTAHDFFVDEKDAEKNGHPDDYGINVYPTCTENGEAYTKCRYCKLPKTDVVLPATGHDYYDEDGELVGGVLDCLNGVMVYTCTSCTTETEGHEIKVAIPGFDFNDITFHKDWDAENGVWNGLWDYVAEPSCTVSGIKLYQCSCHAQIAVRVDEGVKHNIDPDTYIPASAPTCTDDGHVGYEKCLDCDYEKGTAGDEGKIEKLGHDIDKETYIAPLAPTCAAEGHVGYEKCLREGCGYENGIAGDEGILEKVPHTITLITDVNNDAYNGEELGAQNIFCDKYTYMHYGCTVCNDPETETWVSYVAATGHNMEITTEPECVKPGKKTCTNDWCHEDPKYFYEEVPMLKHIDENGNVIECVSEDFYCYRCCEPKLDEDEKFTGEYAKETKHSWKESHYETFVTIVQNECTEWHYVLYVCKACEAEWMVGEAGYDEHLIPDERIESNWTVLPGDEATFDAPGTKSLLCTRPGCNAVIKTKEYTRDDIEFSFTIGNIYNDKYNTELSIVNSGYVAVKVNLAAYEQMLHSFKFTLNVNHADSQLLTYVGYEVPAEYADVIYKKVYVGQDGGAITVYATIENEIDSEVRDYLFTGSENHVLTLYFKVADDANTEDSTTKATFTMTGSDAEVRKVDTTAITSAFEPVAVPEIITISILGGVNNDAETTDGVANQVDVNAIRKLVAERGYVAEADIDKDGEITLTDFDFLAKYLVGNNTYGYICAIDDCDIADKVSH